VGLAVVDQAQRPVAMGAEQIVGLEGVDLPAEQVRDLAAPVPGRVVLEAAGEVLEQQVRGAGRGDLLVDRATLARQQVAGQPVLLLVEDQARADLEDVGALAEQPRPCAART
jgi:hypothetical protein